LLVPPARDDSYTSARTELQVVEEGIWHAPFRGRVSWSGGIETARKSGEKSGGLNAAQSGIEEALGWVCITASGQGLVIQRFTRDKMEEVDLESFLW